MRGVGGGGITMMKGVWLSCESIGRGLYMRSSKWSRMQREIHCWREDVRLCFGGKVGICQNGEVGDGNMNGKTVTCSSVRNLYC